MQDATTNGFVAVYASGQGQSSSAFYSTCRHLIQAKIGADKDLQESLNVNNEVFNFLSSVCNKYGIGFWARSRYYSSSCIRELCFPGGMMIGTDSHTVNAGGLGIVAMGVGGADAVDVMAECLGN